MTSRRTEDLIADLVRDLAPRPPLRPPAVRAALWLAGGTGFVVAMAWLNGLRPDLARHFADPRAVLEWGATLATAVTAAIAAFHLALPDRDARWGLLPLPPGLAWLATLGQGCVADWLARGSDGVAIGASPHCLKFIAFTSVPLVVGLLLMLRHAAAVRPGATAALGSLAAAALAAAGLTLFHDLDTSIMVLVWHGVPIGLMVAVGGLLGRPALRALARNSAARAPTGDRITDRR